MLVHSCPSIERDEIQFVGRNPGKTANGHATGCKRTVSHFHWGNDGLGDNSVTDKLRISKRKTNWKEWSKKWNTKSNHIGVNLFICGALMELIFHAQAHAVKPKLLCGIALPMVKGKNSTKANTHTHIRRCAATPGSYLGNAIRKIFHFFFVFVRFVRVA